MTEFADHGWESKAHIAGTLCFAYQANPDKITSFGRQFHDGIGVEEDTPVFVLRRYMKGIPLDSNNSREFKLEVAERILTCVRMHINDVPMAKMTLDRGALDFFREFYKGTKAEKVLQLREKAKEATGAKIVAVYRNPNPISAVPSQPRARPTYTVRRST
jgi:hypothetical protein